MQEYFTSQSIHCQGPCDLTITNQGLLYTVGSDDIVYSRNLKTGEERRAYMEASDGSYHSLAAHSSHQGVVVLAGASKTLDSCLDMDKEQVTFLYKLLGEVKSIEFSSSGEMLAIACQSQSAIIYNWKSKKGSKCRPCHTESVLSVWLSSDDKYVCSTGTDGFIMVYALDSDQDEDPSIKFNFQISKDVNKSQSPKQILKGMFNPDNTIIACPGRSYLQVIEISKGKFNDSLKTGIKHSAELSICHWHTNNILITGGLDDTIRVWNFNSVEEIITVPDLWMTRMVSYQNTFFGINTSGTVFKFAKPGKLQSDKQSKASQSLKEVVDLEPQEKSDIVEEEIDNQPVRRSKTKADKMITTYPQLAISRSTKYFSNNRYLLYNTVGCIIERTDGTSNSIQLEYHDTKIINKRRTLFTDRQMKYFDLQINKVAYANEREYGFFGDCFWEHQVPEDEEVQSICIGNEWVAVAMESKVLIFDLAGNNTNNFCFDKSFIAMAAYEDVLVIVFVDSVPMWGCENLRMSIKNVGGVGIDDLENVMVPVKPSSSLKSFGFSEEGLLYSEDSKGWLRAYCMHSKQWTEILSPKSSDGGPDLRLWIVGISGYQLLAFKLLEGEYEPTVLPKMHPRKVKLRVPTPHSLEQPYTNADKVSYGQLMWKKVVLQHERHRYRTWYRYKFARSQLNSNYQKSSSILSEEELKTKENSIDNEFVFLIKNFLMKSETERAYITAKTFIKSEKHLKRIIGVFTQAGLSELATKIQNHYDEQARLQQYDYAQKLKLKQLQQEMEKSINLKPIDPMCPKARKQQTVAPVKAVTSQQAPLCSLKQENSEERKADADNPFAKQPSIQAENKIKKEVDLRFQKSTSVFNKKKAQPGLPNELPTKRS